MEVLDARKVVDIRCWVCRVMVDGEGVVTVVYAAVAALDRAIDTRSSHMDDVVAVEARGVARDDIARDGGTAPDVYGIAVGDDTSPAVDAAVDGDAVGDVHGVAQRCVVGASAVDIARDIGIDVHNVLDGIAARGTSANDFGRCVRCGGLGDGDDVLLGSAGGFCTHDLRAADIPALDLDGVVRRRCCALCADEFAGDAAAADERIVLFGCTRRALCSDQGGDAAARNDGMVLVCLAVLRLGTVGIRRRSGFDR